MKLKEVLYKIPDTFYKNLYGQLFESEYHTSDSLNNSLREVDRFLEKVMNLKFPCSDMIYQSTGEVYYSSLVKRKTYREHIIPVSDRMIECRKLILHKKVSKYQLYNYLLNTLYLVYKDSSEKLEAWEAEEYIREDLRMKDSIEYFHNNKI